MEPVPALKALPSAIGPALPAPPAHLNLSPPTVKLHVQFQMEMSATIKALATTVSVAVIVVTVDRTVPSRVDPAPPSVHLEPSGSPVRGHVQGEPRPLAQVMGCAQMVQPERVVAPAMLGIGVQLARAFAL